MTVRVLLPPRIDGTVPEGEVSVLRGRSMGCAWSASFVATPQTDVPALAAGIERVLQRVVQQMSTWEPASDISQFNRAAPGAWLPMPQEFALVLACALHVARQSGGALDPTAGALARLWGFGATGRYHQAGFQMPAPESVAAAQQHCGWQKLKVDVDAMQMQQPGGMELDFSAVAKGFAVDEVSAFLRAAGVLHHLVDIGGELRGAGMKPDGQPWWVEVQLPPDTAGLPRTRIALHGLAVATSGDYLQGFTRGARQYSHCIDPATGAPTDNDVCSVTVIHAMCMQADAWATALMVLGPRAGRAVADEQQLAVQWLVYAGEGVAVHSSNAWRAMVVQAA
ncbi:MAG: FAD:protein FMN transferase [Steroidobacteraceae bacterium]